LIIKAKLENGNTKQIHYITSPTGLVAIYVMDNSGNKMYYALTDHLGSINSLLSSAGSVVEEHAFDSWGNRRDPHNWGNASSTASAITDRGFTLHEHLYDFDLIHMNGRVYCPTTMQFVSTDPFIQALGNTANYNRYSYCLNDPINHSDPSGYQFYQIEEPWFNPYAGNLLNQTTIGGNDFSSGGGSRMGWSNGTMYNADGSIKSADPYTKELVDTYYEALLENPGMNLSVAEWYANGGRAGTKTITIEWYQNKGDDGGLVYTNTTYKVVKDASSNGGMITTDLSNIDIFQADANFLMVAGKDLSAKAFGFGFEYGYGVKYNVFGGKLSENGLAPTLGEPLAFFKLGNSLGGFNYEKSIYSGKVNFNFKIGVVEFSKSRGADIVLWDVSAAQGLGVNSKGTLNLIHTFVGYSDMQQKFYDVNGHMCPIIP
jgi:RHS repeat-associated protein